MIFGIDPIYLITLGMVGMLVFVTVMYRKMGKTINLLDRMVLLLEGINHETREHRVYQSQNSGPLVSITTTDPLLAVQSAPGASRREPVQPLSASEPVIGGGTGDGMDATITMPRVRQ